MGTNEVKQDTLHINGEKTLKHLEMVINFSQSESNRLSVCETKNLVYTLMNKIMPRGKTSKA